MITQLWSDEQLQLRNRKTKSPGFFQDPGKIKASNHLKMPDNPPERQISARIFPNGEFGVGFIPHRGMSAQERRFDRDYKYAQENAYLCADIKIDENAPEGFIYTRELVLPLPPKLGIGAKSSQRPNKYGGKGITSYGRKMLRNAGHIIDKACESRYNRLPQMGTLTVPSYQEETMMRICANWADIVRKFFQRLKRHYAKFRYNFDYASCTEIQPQRWAERREVGLHIHFLFVAIRLGKNKWVLPDNYVREVWRDTLAGYLGVDEVVQEPNYRRDTVRQSSAAYMAKYASKGCDIVREVREEKGEAVLPSQWWSISSGLRKIIGRYTILSQDVVAEKLLVISRWGVSTYIKYIRCITLQTNCNEYAKEHDCPTEIVLGYGGLLSSIGYGLFSSGNQAQSIQRDMSRTLDKFGIS